MGMTFDAVERRGGAITGAMPWNDVAGRSPVRCGRTARRRDPRCNAVERCGGAIPDAMPWNDVAARSPMRCRGTTWRRDPRCNAVGPKHSRSRSSCDARIPGGECFGPTIAPGHMQPVVGHNRARLQSRPVTCNPSSDTIAPGYNRARSHATRRRTQSRPVTIVPGHVQPVAPHIARPPPCPSTALLSVLTLSVPQRSEGTAADTARYARWRSARSPPADPRRGADPRRAHPPDPGRSHSRRS
jgi:hypothetical protein